MVYFSTLSLLNCISYVIYKFSYVSIVQSGLNYSKLVTKNFPNFSKFLIEELTEDISTFSNPIVIEKYLFVYILDLVTQISVLNFVYFPNLSKSSFTFTISL